MNNTNTTPPEKDITFLMDRLHITEQEALDVWLTDRGLAKNEEQEKLCEKAKANRITATIHQAKAQTNKPNTQRTRTVKANPTKEMIIQEIAQLLPNFAENITILNKNKLISFKIEDDIYEIDLKQKRKAKK